jgi:hypothetical protein
MSPLKRAFILGMAGPAVQAVGIVWQALHILTEHLNEPLTARHLAFEPAVLVIVVGFLLSLVCIPTAIEVARATPAEVELPVLGAESEGAMTETDAAVRGV